MTSSSCHIKDDNNWHGYETEGSVLWNINETELVEVRDGCGDMSLIRNS